MKLFLIVCLFPLFCFGQNTSKVDSLEKENLKEINMFYIAGLKKIRHDAILKCKFRKVHKLKSEIKTNKNKFK